MSEFVSPKNDLVFKIFFTRNKDLLRDFLSHVLNVPTRSIRRLKIINPYFDPRDLDGKSCILDICAQIDNQLVDIEMQIYFDRYFRERTLFYWAQLYVSQLKRGEKYAHLRKTITINILDFNMFEGNNYHTEVSAMIKGTGEIFSDKFGIHFLELRKLGDTPNVNDMTELWLRFLNANSKEEYNMLKSLKVPVIDKAIGAIYDMSIDSRLRELVRRREDALRDYNSRMSDKYNIGKKQGREEGLQMGREEGLQMGREEGLQMGREAREIELLNGMRAFGLSDSDIGKIIDAGNSLSNK